MNLLLPLAVLFVMIVLFSGLSTWMIGRRKQLSVVTLSLLVFAPVVDGVLAYILLDWLSVGGITLFGGALAFGIISHVFLQPMLVPQRLIVWRLAKQNILRRKRQAALLMLGLIIASSIITSSMIVGDSLDATVLHEVEGSWGETDITVSGFDMAIGQRSVLNESIAHGMWDSIQNDPELLSTIRGQQQGLIASASLSTGYSSVTSVTWMAMNSTIDAEAMWPMIGSKSDGIRYADLYQANLFSQTPHIAINQVLADELDVNVDDVLNVTWYVTEDGSRVRTQAAMTVFALVPNQGQGASAGTQAPAVFTDLATAQRLQSMESSVNTVYYSVVDGSDDAAAIEPVLERLEVLLDHFIGHEDIGLSVESSEQTNALTVSSSKGLGRISGDLVRSMRENTSTTLPGYAMMEVLQVPVVEFQSNDENIVTLASREISALHRGSRGVWHVSPNGAGVQIDGTGDSWVWRAEDGEKVHDFSLDSTGLYGLVAHDSGLLVAFENEVDEDYWAVFESNGSMVSAASMDSGWMALEERGDELFLHSFDLNLTNHHWSSVDVELPSTVLSTNLVVDGGVYLEIEGLLSTTQYAASSPDVDSNFTEISSSQFPPEVTVQADVDLHMQCDLIASLSMGDNHWCTFEQGLMRWNHASQSIESIRIPIVSTAGGFGTLPQLFLAFGGVNTTVSVSQGEVQLSQRLNQLNLSVNESEVWVKGLIPYAFGDNTAYRLYHAGAYSDTEAFDNLEELDGVVLGLLALTDAETLASASEDERSLILFSSNSSVWNSSLTDDFTSWLDEQSNASNADLQVRAVKIEAAALAAESSGVLSAMFLVFGTFTIVAGILLVLTIVIMLAEARRSELGTLRSLGFTQSDARALAVQEGIIVAAIASVLGSLFGIVLAWFISIGFQGMFSSVGSNQFLFDWTWTSLASGAIWGFMLAFITLWSSSLWTSKLNIVLALRGGRIPRAQGVPWVLMLVQIVGFGIASLSLLSLLVTGLDSSFSYFLWVIAGVGGIVVLVPVFTWQLPVVLRTRSPMWERLWRHVGRNTLAWVGASLLVWTVGLASIDPVRRSMEPDELSFIVLGLVEVFAGVLLLTSAAPMAVRRLGKSKVLTSRWGPVLPVSLAYPLATPVRTAVVMGMFSITVFSVVVLGGYTEQFDNYSSSFVEEAEGEYELLLTGSRAGPIELADDVALWNLTDHSVELIDSVGRVHRSEAFLQDTNGERMPYVLRGFDPSFSNHGGLPLHAWDESLGSSELEVWSVVHSRDDLVLLDASFGLESLADGSGISSLSFSIGDSITLIDLSNPGNTRQMIVAGFLEQSSYLFSAGVWMNDETVIEQFDGRLTRMYVSISNDAQPSASYSGDSVVDFPAAGKSHDVRKAASELELELKPLMNAEGVQVTVISDEVLLIQSLVLALLSIFEGYLALGLIVGIAGIGVVTYRSVSERRTSIGILRALGYRQRMVLWSFYIEVSWVSVLGMVNGILIAIGFHRALYLSFWKDQGATFSLPFESIFLIFFGGWILVLLATYIPIKRATTVPASAALRGV